MYRALRQSAGALLCAVAFFAAGCHNNNLNSGAGIAYVTLTDDPGDFTTYTVNVVSVSLTRNDGASVGALGTRETVDFTKLNNIAELLGTATIPTGIYTQATIVLDYTNAVIGVMVNGVPTKATVVDSTGAPLATTVSVNVNFDPANLLNIVPTFATTAAVRLALDFNLAASTTSINLGTTPNPTVMVKPYFTAAIAPPDNKYVRVRGPLINSSVNLGTYTVEVRPFFDEINSLGSLTLFVDDKTIYTLNTKVLVGTPGITQLSQSSAGATVVAGYTTYEPTPTPSATAAIFHVKYLVGGSTLEDVYTQGIEGDVVARNGNTLTLRGSTLQINDGSSIYNFTDATLLLGPNTIVTADDDTALTGLNYNSVAVGQHIIARGIYSLPTAGDVIVDATGSTTNTGSVRLIPTNLWGALVSSTAGNLLLNLQTLSNWPVTDFAFAGNGTTAAADPTAANFSVNTGALVIPDTTVGDPVWIDGIVAPFGAAPPDFTASAVNSELSVQMVGAVAPGVTCGQAVSNCLPASMRVAWASPGTKTPLTGLGTTAVSVDVTDATSAIIRVGAESIDMKTLPVNPQIIATAPPAGTAATAPGAGSIPVVLPPIFLPEYSFGDPLVLTNPGGINQFSVFATFASGLATALATTPALQLEARGTYNRTTNTFTAISVNVVL
jgi:Domain of unknown function (DUF4382)